MFFDFGEIPTWLFVSSLLLPLEPRRSRLFEEGQRKYVSRLTYIFVKDTMDARSRQSWTDCTGCSDVTKIGWDER